MRKGVIIFYLVLIAFAPSIGQNGEVYHIHSSEIFKTPRRHDLEPPIGYGQEGIIQVSHRKSKSFSFQKFSTDLKYVSGKEVNTEALLGPHSSYNRFVKLNNKTYLFVRELNKEAYTEGISALEFSPTELDFVGQRKPLFQSSDRIRLAGSSFSWGYSSTNYSSSDNLGTANDYNYNFVTSADKSKFLYTYALLPKERKDYLNHEVIGMHVFDEDLNKVFGGEFEMPYSEAKMDNLGYTVANNGTVYLLARVYETARAKETAKDNKPNYHFEVLVYDKPTTTPTNIKLTFDQNFPKEAYIFEDTKGNVVVSGFYGKSLYSNIEGVYMVKFQVINGVASKVNGDFYSIPNEIIKSYTSDREKRRMEIIAGRGGNNTGQTYDIGVDNLKIKKIYETPNGATKIVSEQYHVDMTQYYDFYSKTWRIQYYTYADDIFVISIDSAGTQEWVKKIPKAQYSGDAYGDGLSINSIVNGNNLELFYVDKMENLSLPVNQPPYVYVNGRRGYVTGVSIDDKGNVKKYSLGDAKRFKTNFFIRRFVNGGRANLISTLRKGKKNKLFSIDSNSPSSSN